MSNYPPGNDPYGQQPPYQGGPHQQGYPPQGQQPKKGNKVLMWSLIGCGSLLVIAIISAGIFFWWVGNKMQEAGVDMALMEKNPALAAAKIAISMNPDVELVSMDENKGTLTVRDKKSGKVVTINAEQVQDGKITISGDGEEDVTIDMKSDGTSGSMEVKKGSETATFGANTDATLPDWLPAYTGASVQGIYSTNTSEAQAAGFNFTTDDSPAEVIEFYESELKDTGFKVTTSSLSQGGTSSSQITAQDSSNKRIVFINAAVESGSTKVTMVVTTKK